MSLPSNNPVTNNRLPFQRWPTKGVLHDNLNLELSEFEKRVKDKLDGGAHYTVKSVIPRDKKTFVQTGCGPNFEGDLVSQCTCRHDIRATWYSLNDWENKWLAGFTGFGKDRCGASYLFYLMKVEKALSSFKQLYYEYQKRDKNIIKIKRADLNPLGDLYVPKSEHIDDHDVNEYYDPHHQHPHRYPENRLQDINYPDYTQKKEDRKKHVRTQASLLIGDPNNSYLWSSPMIQYKGGKAPRHKKYTTIRCLIDVLRPVDETILHVDNKRKFITC